jgi:serine protease
VVKRDGLPALGDYDCLGVGFDPTNERICTFATPEPGAYLVRLLPAISSSGNGFSGMTLYANFVDENWPRSLQAEARTLGRNGTRVTLHWEAGKERVDLYRNGALLRSIHNDGSAIDTSRAGETGEMTYTICNSGT